MGGEGGGAGHKTFPAGDGGMIAKEPEADMKAISLWQPWATAIAVGAKRIETRHWPTKHRGPLMIHAAKRKVIDDLIYYHSCWNWQGALRSIGWSWGGDSHNDIHRLPFGALVATCSRGLPLALARPHSA